MSSAMLMERASMMTPTMNPMTGGMPAPTMPNVCMVPRCEIKFTMCADGCKIYCKCTDEMSCATLQNLCKMLADGMCSCCCTWNGMTVCQCNLCCGNCKCEMTADGVCISCCSGDQACCEMIQKCCECLQTCCENGCTCVISFGGTPVCCGTVCC